MASSDKGMETRTLLEEDARIDQLLERIRRRVFVDILLRNIALDLGISLGLLALLYVVDRVFFPGLVGPAVVSIVLVAGFLASIARTLLGGRLDLLSVAVLTDERLRLKERVSSAVALRGLCAELAMARSKGRRAPSSGAPVVSEEWADLVAGDAVRFLQEVPIQEKFPVRVPRRAAWTLLCLAVCLALSLWLPSYDILGVLTRKEAQAKVEQTVQQEEEKLEKDLALLEKEADEKAAPEVKKLLELLRQNAADLSKEKPSETAGGPSDPKKDALVEMARREDALKKGLDSKAFEPLKEAAKSLKDLNLKESAVSRKLSEALKEGDFKKAEEALKELKDDLSSLSMQKPSELTPAEKARLEKLSKELESLSKNCSGLSKFSSALSAAAQGLNAGNLEGALDGLEGLGSELESLAKLAEQMDLLNQALDLVKLSKEDLASLKSCPMCGTPYCRDCGKPQCSCKAGLKPGGT